MLQTRIIAGLEVHSAVPEAPATVPPLLFVHGAFAGGWMWTETFMPFFAAAGVPCHALSLRGHGGSVGRERMAWHAISDYVDDVASIAEWVAAEYGQAPVLVGHSMGGFVVQKYLERAAVPGAVLLCSVPPQGLIAAQFHLLLQKPQLFAEINHILAGEYTDTATLREALFAGEVDEAMLQAWLGQMQNESQRAIWDMSMFNLPQVWRMHRSPMLILGAEKDMLVPAFLVQSTAQTYGLDCHVFRDMGHAVTHEKEWPQVAAAIGHWLSTLVGASDGGLRP